MTLPPGASVFRLKSSSRKNLSTEEYSDNLAQYLDDQQNISSLTMNDLNIVLGKLKDKTVSASIQPSASSSTCSTTTSPLAITNEDTLQIAVGEHVAVFWVGENNSAEWYLGVVESIEQDSYTVLHLVRKDITGCQWVFPYEPDVHVVENEQVLASKLRVQYHHSHHSETEMRCTITKEVASKIQNALEKLK